jgi:NAD(P)-dependent dehydrogenase (short-subunit alcohol dehydrogenase family)
MEIKDVVAVVTGGASGLGQACVEMLSAKGARVICWDRQTSAQHSMPHYTCDVSSEDSVKQALEKTIENHGVPRILIQCAGIISATRLVGKAGPMSLNDFKKVIDVNLVGTFNVMRLIAESMTSLPAVNAERGIIINTASIAAFEGQIGQVAYSASKGGVVAMTLPVARELGKQGIRVNTIAPGLMETPMLAGLSDEVQSRLKETFVFPERLGRPNEFAALACHIVENSLLNGEVIRLDGAIRLQPK